MRVIDLSLTKNDSKFRLKVTWLYKFLKNYGFPVPDFKDRYEIQVEDFSDHEMAPDIINRFDLEAVLKVHGYLTEGKVLLYVQLEALKEAEHRYNKSLDESNRLFQEIVVYRQEIRRLTCLGELAPKVYPVEVA